MKQVDLADLIQRRVWLVFFCLGVVRGRPNLAGLSSEGDFAGSGVLTVGQAGVSAPPLGIAYGKVCI